LGVLGRLWRGEVPLADAFWNWAVLGGLAVNLSTSLLFLVFLMQGWTATALFVGYACSVPYNILVTIGVWRSAARASPGSALARIAPTVTLLGMVVLSLT
jgi:hypothetical protein